MSDKQNVNRNLPSTAWKPGQSGNPNGRPKKGDSLREMVKAATNDGEDPIQFLVKVLQGKVRGCTIAHRMQAATELLDRGFGKPTQYVEGKMEHDVNVTDPKQALHDRITTLAARAAQDGGVSVPD